MRHKIFSFFCFFLTTLHVVAQETNSQVEMADQLRADGKIWVVIAVITTTFLGIVAYLVRLDGKMKKLEKELKR